MRPPFHLVDLVKVDVDCFCAAGGGDQRPCGFFGVDFVGEIALVFVSFYRQSKLVERVGTFMIGSWPLIPTTSFFFLISTMRSLPFRLPGTSRLMSRLVIVCVHL